MKKLLRKFVFWIVTIDFFRKHNDGIFAGHKFPNGGKPFTDIRK